MKVVVIPDVHLKPWIFDQAERVLREGRADIAVALGDYMDDWNQQGNTDLYRNTLATMLSFAQKYPQTKFCIGNHDFQYLKGMKGAGYSPQQLDLVRNYFSQIYEAVNHNFKILFNIDNVVFSHAGLLEPFVKRYVNEELQDEPEAVFDKINYMGEQGDLHFFDEDSPIWARPDLYYQGDYYRSDKFLNVYGHTPVQRVNSTPESLSLDVYSTYRDGHTPIGEQHLVIVDTVTKEWQYA